MIPSRPQNHQRLPLHASLRNQGFHPAVECDQNSLTVHGQSEQVGVGDLLGALQTTPYRGTERGLNAEVPTKWENGILIFSPGPDSEMITLEKALAVKDAMESELP